MPTPESVDTNGFKTLNQLFLEAIEKRPKPDAFLYKAQGRYHPCSSQDALKKTAALASAFLGGGIRAGDRVAILAENRLEWALTDYAVMALGAMVVPIYPTLLDPDVEFILRDSQAKAIVASTETQLAKVLNIKHRLPELALVVMMDPVPASAVQVESWHKLVESELAGGTDLIAPFRKSSLTARPEDTATILYTSGTTGRAKGVVLTHNNISSNIRATLMVFPLSDRDTAISFLPLSHIFERMLDYTYFWRGVSIAYAESLEALPKNLLEVRPTVVAVVPRVLEKILDKVKEKVRRAPSFRQRLFHWAVNVGKDCLRLRQAGRVPRVGMRVKRAVADALVFKKIRAG